MLISPDGFPVFVPVPERASPALANSTSTITHQSPGFSQPPLQPIRQSTIGPPASNGFGQYRPGIQPPPVPEPLSSRPMHAPLSGVPPPLPTPPTPVGLTFASIITSFRTSSESVTAWTFYSLGLANHPGQKEIAITLRQRPSNYSLEAVQPIMYQLYQQMNQHIIASGGRPLTAGEVFPCRLNTPDLGPKDMSILLIHSPPECKTQLENKDVLYGLIATMEETAVFTKYGAARAMTNMGSDLETWPVPLWSDWSRPSLLTLQDFQGSLTEMVSLLPTKNIVATLDNVARRLTIVISTSALELIQADLTRFPPAQPGVITENSRVTFLLDLDAGSQAYLTWRAGQQGTAVFNARPNPTSFHGCWISFAGIAPYQAATVQEGIAAKEDGIELKMGSATWERMYQALISKTPAVVPVGGESVQLSYA
ncbi:hypothetical protein BG006_002683 [Podila minutissima]|uniref:Uncharacterized protein n=1 Tax=Podila minutissima TaxID=64525 RepID=A0A9P5SS60_9FUNG|nr:hypothetical protein BG006_002683 [Podila minutissima]